VRSVALFGIVFALSGCVTSYSIPGPYWDHLSPGWKETMRAAGASADAYHFIADSSVVDLRDNPETMARASSLVTQARDSYRRAQTYGAQLLPRNFANTRLDTAHVFSLAPHVPLIVIQHQEVTGKNLFGDPTGWASWFEVKTQRQRTVLVARGTTVTWSEPFKGIAVSDAMAPIEDIVFRIKRE